MKRPNWGERSADIGAGLTVASIVLAFCLFMTWRDAGFFWHDDAQSLWVPLFSDIERSFHQGEWPILTPYNRHGTSLLGEYTPGLFSPLVLTGQALALALGRNMPEVAALYGSYWLLLTTLGAFCALRLEGISRPLAAMAAVAVALNGWNLNWAAIDWFPYQAGFASMMWFWAAALLALRFPDRRRYAIASALGVMLVVTAGERYLVAMSGVLTIWLWARACHRGCVNGSTLTLAQTWLFGLGLAAPAWLTLGHHFADSTRADIPLTFDWFRSVPLAALPGFLLPTFPSPDYIRPADAYRPAVELSNGFIPAAVVLTACLRRPRGSLPHVAWPLLLLAVALVLACAPSPDFTRWSYRWLPLAHVAMLLTASHWLMWHWERSPASWNQNDWLESPALWGLLALYGCQLFAGVTVGAPASLAWGIAAVGVLWAVSEPAARRGRHWARWFPLAGCASVIVLTHLHLPVAQDVPTWRMAPTLQRHPAFQTTRRYLLIGELADLYPKEGQQTPFGQIALIGTLPALAGIEFVNGYSAVGPRGTQYAYGFSLVGQMQAHRISWMFTRGLTPGGLLDRGGIDGLVVARLTPTSTRRLQQLGWEHVASAPDGQIWHRPGPPKPLLRCFGAIQGVPFRDHLAWDVALADARGWPAVDSDQGRIVKGVTTFASRETRLISHRRNVVTFDVAPGTAPAIIGVMRGGGDAWRAQLGGEVLPVVALDGSIPGVMIPAGRGGLVTVRYSPGGLDWGLAVAAVSAATMVGWSLLVTRRRRRLA
ncbi:MAG: hypothetical protein VKP62_03405 [Candidatus Sericytochromatia bacterium]|nr:hypothetical protein [Candidatus Sericytochromatia bacterium]